MAVKKTKHREEPASYYNIVYKNALRAGGYDTDRYKAVYDCVMDWLTQLKSSTVLECGCGTGVLADRIIKAGYSYRGFDFSQVALDQCSGLVRNFVGHCDAYDPYVWRVGGYDTVIAVETFEHLDDLRVLAMIPVGTKVIFSVPDFSSRSHLRIYPDDASIRKYYQGLLDVPVIARIQTQADKAIFVCYAERI